jgi:RimJ/RimL family protein N-acetyltransferase
MSTGDNVILFDRWEIKELPYDVMHLAALWLKLKEFPTLFSDSTRGDIQNWISMIRDDSWVWYEVMEKEKLVGIIYFQLVDDKADIHIAFFDRKPAEKKELVKFFCKFLFDGLPQLHKITAAIPSIYFATWRLAKAVGFKWEGTLREDAVFEGRRIDVNLYGLLRNEAYGLPEESGQSGGDSLRGSIRGTGRSEGTGSSLGRGVSSESSQVRV